MIKRFISAIARVKTNVQPYRYGKNHYNLLQTKVVSYFSQQTGITATDITPEQIKVQTASTILEGEELDYFRTEGGISILNKVPGVKADSGELYILKFSCTVCDTQSMRSFTKHSYHKGVVMVRCGGCDRIHLVADNLGWFQDTPVNIQTMHQGQVRKVHDPLAIAQFLQKAFSQQLHPTQPTSSEQKAQTNLAK